MHDAILVAGRLAFCFATQSEGKIPIVLRSRSQSARWLLRGLKPKAHAGQAFQASPTPLTMRRHPAIVKLRGLTKLRFSASFSSKKLDFTDRAFLLPVNPTRISTQNNLKFPMFSHVTSKRCRVVNMRLHP